MPTPLSDQNIAPDPFSSIESIYGGKDYSIFTGDIAAVPTPLADQNIAPDPFSSIESIYGGKDYSIFTGDIAAVPTPLADQNIAPDPANVDPNAIFTGGVSAVPRPLPDSRSIPNNLIKDWRVRLALGDDNQHFYNNPNPGILAPLKKTNGVIFPYTPTIRMAYDAEYTVVPLTHSNYKSYFYNGSSVGDITIECSFTAQSTQEANYLRAVMHFFKSATKMFYGTDDNRGTPPPVLFLSGFGSYQFNNHACVIKHYGFSSAPEVDYIRTDSSAVLKVSEARKTLKGYTSSISRLTSLFSQGVSKGAEPNSNYYRASLSENNSASDYVPTQVSISITLLPMVSRRKQSQEFSLEKYSSGSGIINGFW